MKERRLQSMTVMVVEDEYFIADELRRQLTDLGANVLGPVGGIDEALETLAGATRLDAAVLDVNLNERMAYAIADALRARGVPLVFATGYDAASLPQQYGDIPICCKPVEPKLLCDLILRAQTSVTARPTPG